VSAPLLALEGICAGHGGRDVVQGVCLEVAAGSLTVLVGANGAGKTTLLGAVAGTLPARGGVRVDGVDVSTAAVPERVARGLALVPEGRQLFGQLSVQDNLLLGAYLSPRRARRARLDRVLATFPRLAERRAQAAGTLSGGEQQLVAIGRALMAAPRVLLLDEPSLGLAPRLVRELFELLCQIRATGTSILLVEQNVRQALAIADRGYVLERGRVVAEAPGAELLGSPRVQRAYLGVL
jgi:branched-chain amino acid transport system ATP-binding protein